MHARISRVSSCMPSHGEIPFVFTGADIDRLALRRVDATWLETTLASPETLFVPVRDEDSVILADGVTPLLLDAIVAQPLFAQVHCTVLLGQYQGHICFALGVPVETILPAGDFTLTNLRPQFGRLDRDTLALLGYARAMVHWHIHNRYCGKCSAPTESRRAGHELHCNRCGNILYPRVNPAIIVLVTHADRCLLGRQSPGKHFSTLAGFVEPGETPEATLRREVWEETNIRVGKLRYLRSQPWPYPASLMLGFRAIAENTDICCNDGELAEARWFSRADIVRGLREGSLTLPTPQSISYSLIREWFEEAPGVSLTKLIADTTLTARS